MNVIDSLLVEAEQEVTRRNHEVVSAVLHDTEWDRRVCAWAAVFSKLNKVKRALDRTCKFIDTYNKSSWKRWEKEEYYQAQERWSDLTREAFALESRLAQLEKCERCLVCFPIPLRIDLALARARAKMVLDPATFEPTFHDEQYEFIAEGGEGD
jgi:hypothetical protein